MELTARQAIKDINAKGELKAISWWAWNMTTPATRTSRCGRHKIVNDGIKYVIGHLCSYLPASDIYEDEGILMISPERPTRS